MRRPPDERGPAGASCRASILNRITKLDAPQHNLIARDPQRRAAAIIARKYALRLGVAVVVASAIGLP
jgi:hypothetical protein